MVGHLREAHAVGIEELDACQLGRRRVTCERHIALDHQLERLADDHRRARSIADALGVGPVDTNIVPLDLSSTPLDAVQLAAAARTEGVLLSVVGPRRARLVTHLDVDDAGCARAAEVVAAALTG